MCLNPRIIINPAYIKESCFGRYPCVHMPHRDFFYSRNAFERFDYKTFHPRKYCVNKDTIDDYYAYNFNGDVLPLYIEVSCGKCEACVMQKRNQLKSRMILEQYSHGDTPPLFLTLTYAPQYLPEDGVSVRDVQLFLKNLRAFIDYHYHSSFKFRYVCFSEYGSKFGRPHYHLLLFGIEFASPRDVDKFHDDIQQCWSRGYIDTRLCDYGCFNYVSKYVCKGSNVPPGKNPNFRLSSRRNGGLGVPAFTDESLYLQLMTSPHPVVTIKLLGKVFTVYIPKSIRDYLCKSPRQFIPRKIQNYYKLFCHKSMLLRVLMDDDDAFSSHVEKVCKFSGILPPSPHCIVPRVIFDKYAAFDFHKFDESIPYYMRNDRVFNRKTLPKILDEYIDLYKKLLNFELDFGKLYHFTYLRSTVYEKWRLSLIRFAENNPDIDPLSVHEFNAIMVESHDRHPD